MDRDLLVDTEPAGIDVLNLFDCDVFQRIENNVIDASERVDDFRGRGGVLARVRNVHRSPSSQRQAFAGVSRVMPLVGSRSGYTVVYH